MVNIIVLDNRENFISYLDTELLDLTETFKDGLRSIEVTYNIEDILLAQEYFKIGNKIFVNGDGNLTSCLYVLNNKVKKDLYVENKYSFSAEEVLVELNYAPLVHQNDITSANGFTTSNGEVKINYNALYYWFNDYFNIGVVQDCISDYVSRVKFNGTYNLMALLRYIEEETGNVFVTRYEKDLSSNTINRYLDFLNQTNENKNWELHFDYDFIEQSALQVLDKDGNLVDGEIKNINPNNVLHDINPANIQFRLTFNGNIMNSKGEIYDPDDESQTPLIWNATDIGLDGQTDNVVISMKYKNGNLALKIHNKTFTISTDNDFCGSTEKAHIENTYVDGDYINSVSLLNGSYFEFYDTVSKKVIFHHRIDSILSTVHEDILDIGKNIANVEYEEDESNTFQAIAPILSSDKNANSNNSLSYDDMSSVVRAWSNLVVSKNSVIPMIVQKMTITGTEAHPCVQRHGIPSNPDHRSAEQLLGEYSLSSNYYAKPIKPNDNFESENRSYEYWVATAYWTPPFRKAKYNLYVEADTAQIKYPTISGRPDNRDGRAIANTPKMGNIETSEENPYAIYNAVAMALKDKKDPKFNITVDVANLQNNRYNEYNVNDKVYLKLPGFERLVTARVSSTVKDLHNITENKVTLENYSINTANILTQTYIDAENINFEYPQSKNLTVTLKDSTDDTNKLKNKVLSFTLYEVTNGSSTLTKKIRTKKTNSQGRATIHCKYDPGLYEMEIRFGGDAKYNECVMRIEISVGGVKIENTEDGEYTTEKTYYDKYGRSPDKKTLMAIGLPTRGSSLKQYGYRFMKATFKNECPACHKDTLYWGWNYGKYFRGRNEWMGSKEGHFFCDNCDADFDGISGENHNKSGKPKMVRLTDPVKSSREEAQKLVNGQMEYGTKKVKVTQKNNTSTSGRVMIGSPSMTIQKKAASIVGSKTGYDALIEICNWMDKNVRYVGYGNFKRSPEMVLSKGGNCCDQTRCILELFDAAGLSEYYYMYYVHVHEKRGHVYAQLKSKQTGKTVYIDPASDRYGCYGFVCKGYSHGSPASTYPNKPF